MGEVSEFSSHHKQTGRSQSSYVSGFVHITIELDIFVLEQLLGFKPTPLHEQLKETKYY